MEYFAVQYVELEVLVTNMDRILADQSKEVRKKLYSLITYNGETIVAHEEFMRVMKVWSTFTANDINNDNELDVTEIQMMMWLLEGAKPINARVVREIGIIDTDSSGSVDRIEWMSYVCAP